MINPVIKEYIEGVNNKQENYNAILSKTKGGFSMKKYTKKIISIAAVLLAIVVVGTVSTQIYAKIQWNIKFKEYQNREYEYGTGTLKEAMETGYGEEVDMEYVEQDGIKVKVDSMVITDDCFEAHINFQFADGIELNSETFDFGYAIYDEENNIYGIQPRLSMKAKRDFVTQYIYEDLGVEYDKNDLHSIQYENSSQLGNISSTGRNIVSEIRLNSRRGFPKSKKIYIRVFDLGYRMMDVDVENRKILATEDFDISDAEWIFAIDVPEKFYNRKTMHLSLSEEIPGVQINSIDVTEMSLIIKAKMDGISQIFQEGKDMKTGWEERQNELIHITDSDGNVYNNIDLGTGDGEENSFVAKFEISKSIVNSKKIFLNMNVNGEKHVVELISK